MSYKTIVLKSCNSELYPDLEVQCKVLQNEEIGEYLSKIDETKKVVGYKNTPVLARIGETGEKVDTVLKTVVNGREYILSEETSTVKERDGFNDIVVTNISSNSNESYVVKAAKFESTYEKIEGNMFMPKPDPRLLTQVDENLIIMTSWGSEAICLAGSYIVTYNALENDYNTLESGAKESTYVTSPIEQTSILKK